MPRLLRLIHIYICSYACASRTNCQKVAIGCPPYLIHLLGGNEVDFWKLTLKIKGDMIDCLPRLDFVLLVMQFALTSSSLALTSITTTATYNCQSQKAIKYDRHFFVMGAKEALIKFQIRAKVVDIEGRVS